VNFPLTSKPSFSVLAWSQASHYPNRHPNSITWTLTPSHNEMAFSTDSISQMMR